MLEALSLPFFQRVLVAGLLASVACGILGAYVVAKRITSITGGLSHAAFGGVGFGYLMGLPPMLGAAGFGLLASVAMGMAHRRASAGLDTLVSMIWSVGMALGILFVALTPGYAPDLMSYLFGSLLLVPWHDVLVIAALDACILLAVLLFHPWFEAVCFDEEFAEASGVRTQAVLIGLLMLASLAIVTLIRVVGVILAIALLTIPAATARRFVGSLGAMMGVAVGLSAVCTTGGLLLSYELSARFALALPPGPLVILLATALYGAAVLHGRLRGGRPGVTDRSSPAR